MMAPVALAERTEDELAALWAADVDDATRDALAAECERRDRAERAAAATRAASRARNAEWETAAYAQYQAVMAYGWSGGLLSEAGKRTGREPWPMLWQGNEADARKLASLEVTRFWDYIQPRTPGPAEYAAALRDAERAARELAEFDAAPEPQPEPPVSARVAATAALQARRAGTTRQEGGPDMGLAHMAERGLVAGVRSAARNQQASARRQSGQPAAPVKPPPPPVTAADLKAAREALRAALLEAEARFMRFLYLPQGIHAARILTGFAAVSNIKDAFSLMPFVRVVSEEEGCGKSLVLELTSHLIPASEMTMDPSAAFLRDMVAGGAVPLIDEIDGLITQRTAPLKALVALLNAMYRRGTGVGRVGGNVQVTAPAMLAGINEGLPKLRSVKALFSRCFEVLLSKPPSKADYPERYRAGDHAAAGRALGKTLFDALAPLAGEVAAMRPVLPEYIALRSADISEPIAAIYDLAGLDVEIRESLSVILGDGNAGHPPQTPGQLAIAGLFHVWQGQEMSLADITRRMLALPGAPWASMWTPATAPRELAALLEPYGIIAVPLASEDDGLTRLGFRGEDVLPVFKELDREDDPGTSGD